ncbi:MAG: class I SAM-dependent methyltransferase [Halioglobus sp.]
MKDKKRARTEHRFRGVTMPTGSHPVIRQVRRQGAYPSIHGNKLWKSSRLLIDYLDKNRPAHCKNVLDVGCGWGISGIWAAKTLGSHVTSMDADPDVFPFLEASASLNGVSTTPLVARFEQLTTKQLAQFDMLIAADICFWDELVDPVYKMVNRAVKAGVKHIIIADPERSTFLEMAHRCEKKHCAEVVEWQTKSPVKASGALMILENA